MKKIMSLLLVGLFLTSAIIPLFFTQASSAQSADEITADRNRRTLFHLIACLNRDTTFDLGDDELTSADDIFAENDGTFAVEQVVEVVGLDVDVVRGAGVMTCLEAMRDGINLLRPGSVSSSSLNEMGNYFIQDAFGTSFATSSASIQMDSRFSSNISTIVAEAEAQMAVYESQISPQGALLILRNRTVGLIDICFEMVGPNNGRGQNGLVFERPGVGFFYEQNRSQVVGSEGNWLSFMNVGGRSSKIFSGFNLTFLGERDRDLFTADINTGFEVSGQNTTSTWNNGVNFFPVGRDTPQTNGYDNGLVDCEFVQDFADIIFNGISVSPEGVLVNPDGTPLTGALADAVADVQSSTGDVEGDNCETAADFAFGFVLCPLLEITDKALGWLDNRIVDALNVNEAYYENEDIRSSWENVRDIAFILLVPAALVMVIGTALQFSFVDAYTVKRALPRLFVAIIFIAISFEVSSIAIELTNSVGRGIAGVVTSPFGGLANLRLTDIFNPTGADNLFATGGVLVGVGVAFLSGVTIFTLFSFIGVAALALLIIFVLLSIRELLIVFLIVISPIAIITWIFPGNDKGWKLWWGTFSKMLLIYPIIMGFLGVGRAFASIVGGAGGDPVVSTIVKLVAFIGPYFFIPKAFQMAGGAFANLAGIVNDRGKGIFDRQRKFRAENRKNKRDRISSNRPRSNNAITRRAYGAGSAIFAQADAAKKDGIRRGLLSSAAGDSRRAAEKRQRDEERQHAEKDPTLQQNIGNDQFGEVLLQLIDNPGVSDESLIKYLQAHNYSETGAIELISTARSLHSDYGHALAGTALMGKVGSNTSYTGGEDQLLDDIIRAGHGSEADMMALLGQARSTAATKGLFHLSGGSYGEDAAMLQALLRVKKNGGAPLSENIEYEDEITGERGVLQTAGLDENAVRELINNRKEEKARTSMQSWDFGRIHATSARKLAGSLHQEVQRMSADASSETDPGLRAQKMRALGQKIAQVRSIQTSISQSSSQEVKEIFADALDNADGSQPALNVGGDSYSSLSELVSIPTQIHGDMEDFVRTNGDTLGPRDAQTVNDLRSLTGGYRSTTQSPYDGMSEAQRRAMMDQQNG